MGTKSAGKAVLGIKTRAEEIEGIKKLENDAVPGNDKTTAEIVMINGETGTKMTGSLNMKNKWKEK